MASRVFILGPGASTQPDFGDGASSALPRPGEYFAYARTHGLREHAALWRLLRAVGIDENALLAGRPTVDELFPLVDAARDALWRLEHFTLEDDSVELERDEAAFDYWLTNPRDDLVALIAGVLQRATTPLLRVPCATHKRFAESLSTGDVVISLNYDLLMDTALMAAGGWSPADGYGTNEFAHNNGAFLGRFDAPERLPATALAEVEPIPGGSRVTLLKPHGSMNWWRKHHAAYESDLVGIKTRSKAREATFLIRVDEALTSTFGPGEMDVDGEALRDTWASTADFQRMMLLTVRTGGGMDEGVRIGPPRTRVGSTVLDPLRDQVWSSVFRAIAGADEVVVIGYDFPSVHLAFQVVFAHALTRARVAPAVTLVDPDPQPIVARLRSSGAVPVAGWRCHQATFAGYVADHP